MKSLFLPLGIFVLATLFLSACNSDDNEADTVFIATQEDLDEATLLIEADITGSPYGTATVGHDGGSPADSTFRTVYANRASTKGNLPKGTIVTKHTFGKDENGNKAERRVTFAMIKREAGYFPEGGDWEYVMMPNDGSANYSVNPNGILPGEEDNMTRGKLTMCSSCHSASGNSNFLFVGQ